MVTSFILPHLFLSCPNFASSPTCVSTIQHFLQAQEWKKRQTNYPQYFDYSWSMEWQHLGLTCLLMHTVWSVQRLQTVPDSYDTTTTLHTGGKWYIQYIYVGHSMLFAQFRVQRMFPRLLSCTNNGKALYRRLTQGVQERKSKRFNVYKTAGKYAQTATVHKGRELRRVHTSVTARRKQRKQSRLPEPSPWQQTDVHGRLGNGFTRTGSTFSVFARPHAFLSEMRKRS